MRLHLAQLLDRAGLRDEAISHAAAVLQKDPSNAQAIALISASEHRSPDASSGNADDAREQHEVLRALDEQLSDVAPPLFVDGEQGESGDLVEAEPAGLRLADVAGMEELKARLEAAVLAPMRHPELARLYGKSARGGLLMYGPPGCGKTFIARALAGEMSARFIAVSLADVLDMFIGQSERNLREIFEVARRNQPCVVFLDVLDALGHKRSQMRNSAARGTVNQLLYELDGAVSDNTGVFVLGATNHPWDLDSALRRPGRFDRTVLVLPPDEPARREILRYHLRDRPIERIDVVALARKTEHYSGADLAYACEQAAERALLDSAQSGTPRMINMDDFDAALGSMKPSIGPWITTARTVTQFSNDGGTYDELLDYLRRRRLL